MARYSQLSYSPQQQNSILLDPLSCSDETYEDLKEDHADELLENESFSFDNDHKNITTKFPVLLEQDLLWDEEELVSLLSREEKNQNHLYKNISKNPSLTRARSDAIEWMLKVTAHYSFSPLTAVLAVNYLDRFFCSFQLQLDKPWMTQLAAVACLSLAAKVEETQVPLLLDFQVEDSKYLFEAKTIQRMEILVLSNLDWKMNPVTPLSFLDYITRRLGLKSHLCWEFLRRCELILLSMISDSKLMCYLPSVIATATMLHVVNGIEPSFGVQYQNQMLGILGVDKDDLNECMKLILDMETEGFCFRQCCSKKRKLASLPGSPNGVMDLALSSDSSDDSWSMSSSPRILSKKSRANEASDACNCRCS